jgi:hypothetical protein
VVDHRVDNGLALRALANHGRWCGCRGRCRAKLRAEPHGVVEEAWPFESTTDGQLEDLGNTGGETFDDTSPVGQPRVLADLLESTVSSKRLDVVWIEPIDGESVEPARVGDGKPMRFEACSHGLAARPGTEIAVHECIGEQLPCRFGRPRGNVAEMTVAPSDSGSCAVEPDPSNSVIEHVRDGAGESLACSDSDLDGVAGQRRDDNLEDERGEELLREHAESEQPCECRPTVDQYRCAVEQVVVVIDCGETPVGLARSEDVGAHKFRIEVVTRRLGNRFAVEERL